MNFREFLQSGPMLLDAGMGTRLVGRGLDLSRSDPCLWNLSAPEVVRSIHESDRHAGSDAVFTNSFGVHRLEIPRASVELVLTASVDLARTAIGEAGFVVASIGPREAWNREDDRQLDVLIEKGVDALALETCQPEEALGTLRAIRVRTKLAILVSVFARPSPEFWRKAHDAGADAVGVNCVASFDLIRLILEDASATVPLPLLVKPSAGLPGQHLTDPADFGVEVRGWMDRGARLIGGCCGTTERHIATLRTAIEANSDGFRPDKTREVGL